METAALSFERAWVLNVLWILPALALLFWWSEQRRKKAIGRIVAPKLRAQLAGNASPLRRWFRSACVLLALALLIAALAGPRLGYDTLEVPHRGRDVVIAMDVSKSMLAPDIVPSRLDRAKLLSQDLISELGGDRIGLVAFAGSAFLQAPLTLDHGAVLTALDELDTTVIPKGGSNIAEAIRTAEEAFGKAEGFSRAIVVMSDGEELSADALAAAKQAAASGVKIFTVGVGSPEGSEIPDGMGDFVRDPETGKIVNSKLDEERLREIAEATGGFYTLLDDDAASKLSVEGIGRMAEADITESSSRRPIERYQWPLGAAIALLMLQSMVGERRRRSAAAALALLFLLPSAGHAAPAGTAAYTQGDYGKAREIFEKRLKQEEFLEEKLPLPGEAAKMRFNAGAAAYRMKDYEKAAQYFSQAALAEDADLRSKADFSFGNTLFRRGESEKDAEKKKSDWKQAITKYESAMKSHPDYREAEENKERVEQLLKELEKEQEQKQDQQQKSDEQKQDQQQKDQQQNQQDQKNNQQQKQQQDQNQQSQQESQEQKQEGQGQGESQQQKEEKSDEHKGGQGSGGQDQKNQDQKNEEKSDKGSEEKEQKDQQRSEQQNDKEGSGSPEKQSEQQEDSQQQEQKQEGQGQGEDGQQKKEKSDEQGKDGDKKQSGAEGQEKEQKQQPSQSGGDEKRDGSQQDQRGPVPQQPQERKEGELRGGGASPDDQPGQNQALMAGEKVEEGKMSEGQARALLRSLQGEEGKVNLHEQQDLQEVSRDW
jgi:Ca-activated chloride channel family protein